MPAQGEKPGFVITQGRIALFISVLSLATLFYQGSKSIVTFDYRLTALEEKWVDTAALQKDLTKELGRLSQSLNELNIVLREVQVRQEEKQ